MKKIFIFIFVFIAISLVGCGQIDSSGQIVNSDDGDIFCTAEAKLCPDGTFVARDSNNNCEFSPCSELIICDEATQCPDNFKCYKFVEKDLAMCYQGNPCSQCDSHQCNIAESYPMQVFCK